MNKSSEWMPTCERFVVYLDIMGFKDIVFRHTHEEVLDIMEQFRLPIKKIKKDAYQRLQGNINNSGLFNNTVIRPVIFSDSVILFSSDNSLASIENMIWQVTFILSHALRKGIPIKGAIAYGEQTADIIKSLYFGRPLIDAWELQEEIIIYGVVFHHTVEKYLVENGLIQELLNKKSVIQYATPLKEGIIKHYLVNWLKLTETNFPKQAADLKVAIPNIYCNVSGSPRRYVDNTIDFMNYGNNKRKNK